MKVLGKIAALKIKSELNSNCYLFVQKYVYIFIEKYMYLESKMCLFIEKYIFYLQILP